MESEEKGESKRPYTTPELTVYGPIPVLTQQRVTGLGVRDNASPTNPNKT